MVAYEMDYYIFEQKIIFIISRKRAKQKLLKTVDGDQSGKRNLDSIMDP